MLPHYARHMQGKDLVLECSHSGFGAPEAGRVDCQDGVDWIWRWWHNSATALLRCL